MSGDGGTGLRVPAAGGVPARAAGVAGVVLVVAVAAAVTIVHYSSSAAASRSRPPAVQFLTLPPGAKLSGWPNAGT